VIAHSTAAYTVLKLAGGASLIILGIQSLAARSAKPRITGVALSGWVSTCG
jgi:threonine/homoserine/homoserine lactone efflux protein